MENELWRKVYQIVQRPGKSKRPRRATYNDADILLTYLWPVLHDRPVYRACQKSNWPIYYRRRNLPNPSTMTRRLRTNSIQQLMHKVEKELINQCPPRICRRIDAKPLPVSRNSKDKEAAYGYAEFGMGKGYKLHAIAANNFISFDSAALDRFRAGGFGRDKGEVRGEKQLDSGTVRRRRLIQCEIWKKRYGESALVVMCDVRKIWRFAFFI